MSLSQSSIESFQALALGFAFAGVLCTGFTCLTGMPPALRHLERGGIGAVATVPVLVFCAPFMMVGAVLRGARAGRQPIPYVMIITILACFWSLLCGRLVLDIAHFLK